MPKVITIYPKVEVYCTELDTMFACVKDSIDDNKYNATVMLPPNTGDTEMIYNFEAYANEVATGLTVQVIVGFEIIYDYYQINCIHVDNEYLEHNGGQVTFTISFEDCHANICPVVVSVNFPEGFYRYPYVLSTTSGDCYISDKDESNVFPYLGLWKFDKANRKFVKIINDYIFTSYFISSTGEIYFLGDTSSQPGMGIKLYDPLTGQVTTLLDTVDNGGTWFMYEDSHGNLYASTNTNISSVSGLYHIDPITKVTTQIISTLWGWQYGFEDSQGNLFVVSSVNAQTSIYKINGASAITSALTLANSLTINRFIESTSGIIYAATNAGFSTLTNYLYYFNGTNFVQIASAPYKEDFKLFTTSNGITYAYNPKLLLKLTTTITNLSSFTISNPGYSGMYEKLGFCYFIGVTGKILVLNDTTVTELLYDGNAVPITTLVANGNIYISSNGKLFLLKEGNITNIFTGHQGFIIELPSGEIFMTSYSQIDNMGLYLIDEDVVKHVISNGYGWEFFDKYKGKLSVSSSYRLGNYIWNDDTKVFDLNPEVDSTYSYNHLGPCSWVNYHEAYDYNANGDHPPMIIYYEKRPYVVFAHSGIDMYGSKAAWWRVGTSGLALGIASDDTKRFVFVYKH